MNDWLKSRFRNWLGIDNSTNNTNTDSKLEETDASFLKKVKEATKDTVVRIGIQVQENGFRPTTYVDVGKPIDFNNTEEFNEVKKKIIENLVSKDELKGLSIIEMPYTLPQELFVMEARTALLNPKLDLTPTKMEVVPVSRFYSDPNMTDALRFHILVINYGIKLYTIMKFEPTNMSEFSEFAHLVSINTKLDNMKITDNGSIEKFNMRLFDMYDLTVYNINERIDNNGR